MDENVTSVWVVRDYDQDEFVGAFTDENLANLVRETRQDAEVQKMELYTQKIDD